MYRQADIVSRLLYIVRRGSGRRTLCAVAPFGDRFKRLIGSGSPPACSHLDQILDVGPRTDGCEECLATGGKWVELRLCLNCGHVGCCDLSPNRHARAHFAETAHPIIRAKVPGHTCTWCWVDEIKI